MKLKARFVSDISWEAGVEFPFSPRRRSTLAPSAAWLIYQRGLASKQMRILNVDDSNLPTVCGRPLSTQP